MSSSFSIVKKGYDPDEVNEYIKTIEEVVKSYKEKDVAIKNAIISAQVAADNIVKNAELEAMSRKYKTMEVLNSMQEDVTRQKMIIKEFQNDYNSLVKKYLVDFNEREFLGLFGKINDIEESLATSQAKLAGNHRAHPVPPSEPTKPIPTLNNFAEASRRIHEDDSAN